MQLIRTTLRLPVELKKAAEQIALDTDKSLQDVFHVALTQYVETQSRKKAQKIVFITHDVGKPLDNLSRSDYYDEP